MITALVALITHAEERGMTEVAKVLVQTVERVAPMIPVSREGAVVRSRPALHLVDPPRE